MPKDTTSTDGVRAARLDGRRVLFEVEEAGVLVPCSISLGALQDISAKRHFKTAEVLQCFTKAQDRIEAAVRHKLRTRFHAEGAMLNLWADDFEDLPADSIPHQPVAAAAAGD
jgi:hypothetical protein